MSWEAVTLGEVLGRQAAERGPAEALVTDRVRLSWMPKHGKLPRACGTSGSERATTSAS